MLTMLLELLLGEVLDSRRDWRRSALFRPSVGYILEGVCLILYSLE